jgi:hypothetical protein
MNGTVYQGDWISLWDVPKEWHIAAVGDFTGDGKGDIVWQNLETGEVGFWELDGPRWTGRYIPLWFLPLEWRIAAAADMTGDGKTDIILQNMGDGPQSGERGLWVMDGTARAGYVLLYSNNIDKRWDIAAAADVTGDGKADLVWQNTDTGEHMALQQYYL